MTHPYSCSHSAALALGVLVLGAPIQPPGPEVVEAPPGPRVPVTDASRLLDGVEAIPPVGTVGQVALWGDGAFAVVLGKQGDKRVPIVGAGSIGRGRVMAWAHGYGSAGAAARLSTGRLLVNSCRWASAGGGRKAGSERLVLIDSDLGPFLKSQGLDALTIPGGDTLGDQLGDATVLVCGRSDLSEREVGAITRFVRAGGGFICFACPWGWAQVHKKPVTDIPLNRVLTLAGIALADGYAEPTKDGVFEARAEPGPEFHAGRALDILVRVGQGGLRPDDPVVIQAGTTATRAVTALPRNDTILRPRLESLLATHAADLVPSPDRPLRESQALERVLLAFQLSEIEWQKPAGVKAHPASGAFPGAVPPTAPEVSRAVMVDTTTPRWHSTGLYAPPGHIIRIALAPGLKDAVSAGLRVRIGCHTDEIWQHDRWSRVPRISASWPIGSEVVQVASAFGGLIYIEVPSKAAPAKLGLTISGAVEAPYFVLGQTTNQEWTSRVRALPGPWAELACDRVILTIPSAVARAIDDPEAIMNHWASVLDADADLAGIPHQRPYPQRYVADTQISAGYMHSGYPIMTHLDAAAFMTDLGGLVEKGWGPYHEMGHNHQEEMWTFDGTGEVTCNLFTLYVLETVCGVADASMVKVLGPDAVGARGRYLGEGAKFEQWKKDPFLALQMYAQLRLAFGWEVYRTVFAEYRALGAGQRPTSDDQKRDQWMIRMSRATGRNLGPFFQAWGVPTTSQARDSINDLPPWMPEGMGRD